MKLDSCFPPIVLRLVLGWGEKWSGEWKLQRKIHLPLLHATEQIWTSYLDASCSSLSLLWPGCLACCGTASQVPLSLPVPQIFWLFAGISALSLQTAACNAPLAGTLRALWLCCGFECHLLEFHLLHCFQTAPVLSLCFPQTYSPTVQ